MFINSLSMSLLKMQPQPDSLKFQIGFQTKTFFMSGMTDNNVTILYNRLFLFSWLAQKLLLLFELFVFFKQHV